MKTMSRLTSVLLLCGLAQAQVPQENYNEAEEAPFSALKSIVESRQTVGAPQRDWVARKKGKPNYKISDVTVDVEGDVYIAGILRRIYDTDFFAIKYNSIGEKQWVASNDNTGDGNQSYYLQSSAKIIADYKDNIYVAGTSGNLFGTAYATRKYNKWSGGRLWTRYYTRYGNGSGYNGNHVNDFVVDNAGNVYVTGFSHDSSGVYHYATVKYNKAGIEQWVRRYGAGYNSSVAAAIALDPTGNVCVTGKGYDPAANRFFFTTIKYNPTGKTLWTRHFNPPGHFGSEARAIAIDAAGNVYVAGFSDDHYYYDPALTFVKYNPDGKFLMSRVYVPTREEYDSDGVGLKIWVDELQNVYLTGTGFSRTYYVIIKIVTQANNGKDWGISYTGGNGGVAVVSDLFVDDVGNVYVTGSRSQSAIAQNWNYLTAKFDTKGRLQWALNYNGPKNGNDYARALAVDGSGNVYVTGESDGFGPWHDIVTIKYSQNLSSTSGLTSKLTNVENTETPAAETNLPSDFYLAPSYPNPFNPSTTIRFGLPHAARVSLKVYNVLSAEVATLVDEQKSAGEHTVNFTPKNLPSGLYFAVLKAGEARLVQRMIYAK